MPVINVTDAKGDTRILDTPSGLSLMEVLRDNGYDEILAMCGGCCSCATCHVHIQHAMDPPLPPMEEDEHLLLELADHYQSDVSRLSCQIELSDDHDGLEVTLVPID